MAMGRYKIVQETKESSDIYGTVSELFLQNIIFLKVI